MEIENPNSTPSHRDLERYGKLHLAHSQEKNSKRNKNIEHKDERDYALGRHNFYFSQEPRMPSESKHGRKSDGLRRTSRAGRPPRWVSIKYIDRPKFEAKNNVHRDKYYEKGPKGLREPK